MTDALRDKRLAVRKAVKTRQMERRIYELPTEMVSRILDEQLRRGLRSETETARALLEEGLARVREG